MAEKTPPQILVSYFLDDGVLPKNTVHGKYATYRAMRRDPTISLARGLVIAPVLASTWSVERQEGVDDEVVEFINEQMQPVRLHLLRVAMLGCIDFGWQGFEKVFKVDERTGRLVVRKLKPLIQDFTEILVEKKTGAYAGLRQQAPNAVDLKVHETLLFNVNVEGTYWYGEPVMEVARLPYEKSLDVEKAATKYDKKIAGSHWIIHYPPGKTRINGVDTDNFEVAKQLLTSLEASGAIAVPRLIEEFIDDLNANAPNAWQIELMGDSGSGGQSFIDRQKYLDALKVRAFGVPERAVLEGSFGTKAEAEAHADLAIVAMETNHETMVQTINWHLVNQLLRFNFGPELENRVYLEPAPITDLAIQFLRDVYTQIIASPDGFLLEADNIDLEALKDRLEIPTRLTTDTDDSGYTSPETGIDLKSEGETV